MKLSALLTTVLFASEASLSEASHHKHRGSVRHHQKHDSPEVVINRPEFVIPEKPHEPTMPPTMPPSQPPVEVEEPETEEPEYDIPTEEEEKDQVDDSPHGVDRGDGSTQPPEETGRGGDQNREEDDDEGYTYEYESDATTESPTASQTERPTINDNYDYDYDYGVELPNPGLEKGDGSKDEDEYISSWYDSSEVGPEDVTYQPLVLRFTNATFEARHNTTRFRAYMKVIIAEALGIDEKQVQIVSITKGSIVVSSIITNWDIKQVDIHIIQSQVLERLEEASKDYGLGSTIAMDSQIASQNSDDTDYSKLYTIGGASAGGAILLVGLAFLAHRLRSNRSQNASPSIHHDFTAGSVGKPLPINVSISDTESHQQRTQEEEDQDDQDDQEGDQLMGSSSNSVQVVMC